MEPGYYDLEIKGYIEIVDRLIVYNAKFESDLLHIAVLGKNSEGLNYYY